MALERVEFIYRHLDLTPEVKVHSVESLTLDVH